MKTCELICNQSNENKIYKNIPKTLQPIFSFFNKILNDS